MADSLGAWSNAPLAYVLAEVRTELIADIKDYQSKLAGKFRDEYPIQRTMHAVKVVATGTQLLAEPDQEMAWEFATPDNRTAVILRTNGVVLHATTYVDSPDFLARLSRVLGVVAKEVPSVYVNRLGLRYVDFILPRQGEAPEDYVDRRLNPDLGLSKQAGGPIATSLAVYDMEQGQLTLRYIRARGKPELPPDLGHLSLDPSPHMKSDLVASNQPTAILDTDRNLTCSPVERLDPDRVRQQFTFMRNDVSAAFKAAITDHARKVWGAK